MCLGIWGSVVHCERFPGSSSAGSDCTFKPGAARKIETFRSFHWIASPILPSLFCDNWENPKTIRLYLDFISTSKVFTSFASKLGGNWSNHRNRRCCYQATLQRAGRLSWSAINPYIYRSVQPGQVQRWTLKRRSISQASVSSQQNQLLRRSLGEACIFIHRSS